MAGTASANQGAREVYGAVSVYTPNGDSAMDETNDALRVNIVAGAAAGGTSSTDDAAFTPAVGLGTPIMAFADEVAPDSVDEGDVGVVRMTLARGLHVNLRDSSGTAVPSGGGVEAAALRVTIASDSTGVLSVDDNGATLSVDDGAGSLTVDGTVTVDDGGGAISVDDNGSSLTVDNPVLSVVGGGTEATAQRVTIASDSTGVLSVDDNGASLTVDGTVAATQSGTWTVAAATSTTAGTPNHSNVGTSSGLVLASSAGRKGLILTNTSTGGQRISLNLANGSAVLDDGVTLWPGDSFVMDQWCFTTSAINGIASAASATISLQQFT